MLKPPNVVLAAVWCQGFGVCVADTTFRGGTVSSFLAATAAKVQGRKRNPNPNFLVRIFSSGVGVFHVNGWGPKSSICPSKHRESNFFWRDIPGFCRDIPGVPEKFEKKKFVFNFRSLKVKKTALFAA